MLFAAAAAALLGLAALFVFRSLESAPQSASAAPGGSTVFTVNGGESAAAVGARLKEAGLIRSELLWTLLARVDSERIKAGVYGIEAGAGTLAIRELLVSGRQLLVKATVPEGYTLKKIGSILEAQKIVSAAAFLSAASDPDLLKSYGIPGRSFEGYLYPDTYLFPLDYPAERVVRAMADNFFRKLETLGPKKAAEYGGRELFELVTLASIVEREYRVDEEAPLIAGVFLNRLRIGMALQSCATVEYVITELQGKPHPEVLYNRDIAIPDPYNTYLRAGLPPGPISAPGRVALSAVLAPEASGFLYFRLVDPAEGRHRFSRTLDDHVKAGVIYLKRTKAGP